MSRNPLRRLFAGIRDRRRIKRRLKTYAGYDSKTARARAGLHRKRTGARRR